MSVVRDDPGAIARAALPAFGLSPDAAITFVKLRENAVYRVDDGDRSYVLRVHRDGYRSDAEIESEMSFVRMLSERGAAVPPPVPTVDGASFARIPTPDRVAQVDVLEWLHDTTPLGDVGDAMDGHEEVDPARFHALGRVLGELHLVSREIGRPEDFDRRPWDRDGLVGPEPLWGDPCRLRGLRESQRTEIRTVCDAIGQILDAHGTDPAHFGVIHADASPENVLVGADGDLTLIDFDDFGEGWYLFDLATPLFWYVTHPRFEEVATAMLTGYAGVAPFTEDDGPLLGALLVARGLTYLGWGADRPDAEVTEYIMSTVAPHAIARGRELLDGRLPAGLAAAVSAACAVRRDPASAPQENASAPPSAAPTDREVPHVDADIADLIARRAAVVGASSPLFYREPLHLVRGEGARVVDARGRTYLDAYNNVPTVGHANPRVVRAMADQAAILNIHTRYLDEHLVEYATRLVDLFDPGLDRVELVNSGSEANDLALRIARQRSGATGILISDFSYHGNTQALVALTTGLDVSEPLGEHVRTFRVPDATDGDPAELRDASFAEIDAAIASLARSGHGVSAILLDPVFSTEGLPELPEGWIEGVAARVRAAGGLVIADEVQSGFARLGGTMWGHEAIGLEPDLVTLGKPMGNGYPMGGVVLGHELHDEFGAANMYFNTFAGTPVSSVVGLAVLDEIADRGLVAATAEHGEHVRERLEAIAAAHPRIGRARGRGLFFGIDLLDADGEPDGPTAKRVVEGMVAAGVLISRVGRADHVLKVRPPLVITREELDTVLDTLARVLDEVLADGAPADGAA